MSLASSGAALKLGLGMVNAVTGEKFVSGQLGCSADIRAADGGEDKEGPEQKQTQPQQDYLAPSQPWLDGIYAGEGVVRQLTAMPLGQGYTVEGQLTGKEEWGGLQLEASPPMRADVTR